MRVAFLTTEYPTEPRFAGGLASYLRRVTRALLESGHGVEVFTLSNLEEDLWDGPVLVHRVKRHRRFQGLLWRVPYFGRDGGYADIVVPAWNLAAALDRRHRESPFDVVQAANYRACGLVAAFRNTIPVVTRISSYEPLWRTMSRIPLTRRQRHFEKAEMLQTRWSAVLYSPSVLLAETLEAREHVKVGVIEPPFFLEPPGGEQPRLSGPVAPGDYGLFFGYVGYLKGCDRLVSVLPGLLERNPDLKFMFVGPVGRFDRQLHRGLDAHIGKSVFILDQQKHPVLLPLIENARFVVLPSRIDNLPNACLEAMAHKRVVIGTHGASFDQLIEDGASGFLVSQDDDGDLASCMERVWRMDPQERERIGSRAAQSLQRMLPEAVIPPLIELFEMAARRPRRRRPEGVLKRLNTLFQLPSVTGQKR